MTTDFRALCAELLVLAEESISYRVQVDEAVNLIDRARALLDQQEPQPPADGEVAELVRWLRREATEAEADGWPDCVGPLARAADLLQHQHPQPVPVSERLPGPEDCDADENCWWFDNDDYKWCLESPYMGTRLLCWTHWLPANALPTPDATNAQ